MAVVEKSVALTTGETPVLSLVVFTSMFRSSAPRLRSFDWQLLCVFCQRNFSVNPTPISLFCLVLRIEGRMMAFDE